MYNFHSPKVSLEKGIKKMSRGLKLMNSLSMMTYVLKYIEVNSYVILSHQLSQLNIELNILSLGTSLKMRIDPI